jgi:REP element-mobilizing transposase RayT
MPFNPDIHHRRSIRLQNYDYSQNGAYFVTLCSWQRECLFGEIIEGAMHLNDFGRVVESQWRGLPAHFSGINLDEFVIMPNHFHGIAHIIKPVGAKQDPSALPAFDLRCQQGKAGETLALPLQGTESGSLAAVIQNFKSLSTRKINKIRNNSGCLTWQKNYYERVIRDEGELAATREYIINNPLQWQLDKENPANITPPIVTAHP